MKINHGATQAVLFEDLSSGFRLTVLAAVKSGADLSGADLRGANLNRADLNRAYLRGASLAGANLYEANLNRANLRGANLYGANLAGANLYGADLNRADLTEVNLSGADLRGADLNQAYLRRASLNGANLYGANLNRADLTEVNLPGANLPGALNIPAQVIQMTTILPEAGPFWAWKKCQGDVLVQVAIGSRARRSNSTGRKCRAEYVKVLQVVGPHGETVGYSTHDGGKTAYRVGEIVRCDTWNENRWLECGGGIHFFLTRAEAEAY